MLNTIHQYWGTALYSFELGNFFKQKFDSFYIFDPNTLAGNPQALPKPVKAQVVFATPRSAFINSTKTNGITNLPMINYHMMNADRDSSLAYEPINSYMVDKSSYDPTDGTRIVMPYPSRYSLNYNISIWANSYRELESMIHALIQSFTRGETHLRWYPNKTTNPDDFLLMRLTWDGMWSDDTDIESLEPKDTRKFVKATMTMIMTALIPKGLYKIGVVHPFVQTSAPGVIPAEGHGGIWVYQTVRDALSKRELPITLIE